MKIEIDFGKTFRRTVAALHHPSTLMLTGAGFFAAAISFSGWDFAWKLFTWGLLFFIPGFLRWKH